MKLISLQSGRTGNCIYVQARGVRLLFDAGISGSQAQQRRDGHGQDIARVDALLMLGGESRNWAFRPER